MRIVDRKTFLAMPAGTFYMLWSVEGKDHHDYCGGVCVKFQSTGNDFVMVPLTGQAVISCERDGHASGSDGESENVFGMEERGESVPADFEGTSREGMYYNEAQYMIYERDDMLRMVEAINKHLGKGQ